MATDTGAWSTRVLSMSSAAMLLLVGGVVLPEPAAADCVEKNGVRIVCVQGPNGSLQSCKLTGTGTAGGSKNCGRCVEGRAYSVSGRVTNGVPEEGISVVLHCDDGLPVSIADCGAIVPEDSTEASCIDLGVATVGGWASCDVTGVGANAVQKWEATCAD